MSSTVGSSASSADISSGSSSTSINAASSSSVGDSNGGRSRSVDAGLRCPGEEESAGASGSGASTFSGSGAGTTVAGAGRSNGRGTGTTCSGAGTSTGCGSGTTGGAGRSTGCGSGTTGGAGSITSLDGVSGDLRAGSRVSPMIAVPYSASFRWSTSAGSRSAGAAGAGCTGLSENSLFLRSLSKVSLSQRESCLLVKIWPVSRAYSSSAMCISSAAWKRSSALRARAFLINPVSRLSTDGLSSVMSGTSARCTAWIVASSVGPMNSGLLVNSSNKIVPSENRSERPSSLPPSVCSGDM